MNGLVKQGSNLFLRGEKVATTPVKEAVEAFLSVLRSVGGSGKVVLVAHNAFGFDANAVLKLVASVGLTAELRVLVAGFADTLPLFRELLPERVKQGKRFSLAALAQDLLDGETFTLHEALEDVKVLEKLMERVGVSPEHLVQAAKPLNKFRASKGSSGGSGDASSGDGGSGDASSGGGSSSSDHIASQVESLKVD